MKPYAFLLSTIALILALSAVSCSKTSQSDVEMNACIDSIMAKMTLDEKLGQLNLPAAGDIVTGQASQSNIGRLIAEGKAGGVFNVKGVEKIKELQRIAVEESRLGIPHIRHGCDSRIRDSLPHPIGAIMLMGHSCHPPFGPHSCHRGICMWHLLDI